MKRLLTLFAAFALVCSLHAQIADNSIAPDFEVTDINGNTYHLYEILESGKPVVMDISATWCGPCWNYHNTHALDDLYDEYGPGGTDELMVLFVEGDGSTNLQCIYNQPGCNSSTQGDWTAGTTTPIIDDASISQAYELGYFPTVYLICTNHLVREVGQMTKTQLYNAAKACPDPAPGLQVQAITFDTDYAFGKVCGTQSTVPSFTVLNSGTETINSMEIELKVNGVTVQTYQYTDPIPSFVPRKIDLDAINMTGNTIVKATITKMNGNALATPISKQKNYAAAKKTLTKSLTLELDTDQYAEETYWELIDGEGNVYAFGGNENVGPNGGGTGLATPGNGAYSASSSYTETMEVPANGCYFLHMVDAYGDGMCSQAGNGSYKLYETAVPTNVLSQGACDFADAYNIFGADGITSVSDLIETGSIRLSPNPTVDQLRVDFHLKSATDVQVMLSNSLGQTVQNLGSTSFVAGQNTTTVKTADLAPGIYFITLVTPEGNVTRKFSKM